MELQYSETTLQIHEEWQRQKWNPITTLGLISFPWSNTLVSVTGGQVYSLLITHVGMQRCIWNLQLPVNSTFKNLNVEFTSLNVEFTSSCRFQIHLCIPTCVISSEYTITFWTLFFFTHSPIASLVACVAWWFWLSAQSNKGRWGQRNCKEIGAGATRNCLLGRVAFLNSPYACVQIIHPSIKYLVISDGRVPSDWKIFPAKQNQNIKELLTQTLTILNIWRENSWQLYWSLNRKWSCIYRQSSS